MADSIEHLIREGLAVALASLAWAKKIEPYKIRIGLSELKEHEVPYIQFYGISQTFIPDRTQVETRWRLAVDLVLRQGTDGLIDQRDLDDKRQEILEAVGAWMELKFNGLNVIQVVPIQATDDLNLFDPFFITTIEFEFFYLKRFVRDC